MLFLNNQDVESLLTIEDCIEVLEDAYREWGFSRAAQFPAEGRMDLTAPSPGPELNRRFTWGAMAGVLPKQGIFALRQKLDIHYHLEHPTGEVTQEKFSIAPGTYSGFLILASTHNAEPLAIVNDGAIQHMRVAGTSAVAAKYLAREDARQLGLIGSGGMARTHVAAFCAVRPIERVKVYSMTPANRERFAREMSEKLGVEIVPVASALEAMEGADIASFCTDSVKPVLPDAAWVAPGMHFTSVLHSEIGDAPARADVIILHERGGVVEQRALGEEEEGPGGARVRHGMWLEQDRPELPTLAELVAGRATGRTSPQQVTYFHNLPGAGVQFAAVGARVYQLAREREAGSHIPTEWFTQNIRD